MRWSLPLFLAACGATEGQLVSFNVSASGPADARPGELYRFTTPSGFDVSLSSAKLFIGGLYFNQLNPAGWAQETSCTLPGVYTGEVRSKRLIDLLDHRPQPFATSGVGTSLPTQAAEVWLTGGDVYAEVDKTEILHLEGVASRETQQWPFTASVTISSNRQPVPVSPALPGSKLLCQRRIVTPIPFEAQLATGGRIELIVDPKAYLAGVDFSLLHPRSDQPGRFVFVDSAAEAGPPEKTLFNALLSAQGAYQFRWISP